MVAALHQPTSQPLFDHIVVLVPINVLHNLPAWISDSFTVITGGKHADGVTENKLVILSDGVYLEIIAFVNGVDPAKRQAHRWGSRPEGRIIDWALTLPGTGESFSDVQARVSQTGAGVLYSDAVPGGRVTPSGTELKWAVAGPLLDKTAPPQLSLHAGEAPFWCFDRTPRQLRVPHEVEGNVRHASGAVGVAGVTVFVEEEAVLEALKKVYDGVYGSVGTTVGVDASGGAGYTWPVSAPVAGDGYRRGSFFLRLAGGGQASAGSGTSIRLALFSRSWEGTVGGVLPGGWRIDIDLVKG